MKTNLLQYLRDHADESMDALRDRLIGFGYSKTAINAAFIAYAIGG